MTETIGQSRKNQPATIKRSNIKKCLLIFVTIGLGIYLALSFVAPFLMKQGYVKEAQFLYKIYRPACHQLAYRSFFLFGKQGVYPRALVGIKGLETFEELTGADSDDSAFASGFIGNDTLGYKVALCQRDVAIYAGLLLFMLVYWISGSRVRAIPWYLWLLIAVVPIGLDGVWQVVSQMGLRFLTWLPVRESTPFLRVLTGALFGVFSAWFIVPSFSGEEDSEQVAAHSNVEKDDSR